MAATPPVQLRHRAFTLIELMVVVVIIAILSGVIVAEMGGTFQDALLRSSSRQLISVFSVASSRAISLNRLLRVRIDRATGRYAVEKHARGDEFIPAEDISGGSGALDSRISVRIAEADEVERAATGSPERTPSNAINFYPDGTADGREIELRDRDGFGLSLRVNPVTARVQVLPLERQ